MSSGEINASLNRLIEGRNEEVPRIPVMEIRPTVEAILGKNFPSMFNYRSVVFDNYKQTRYGIFIDVDSPLVGESLVVRERELTPEFVRQHPKDIAYLLPALIEAAEKESLTFLDLDISRSIEQENRLAYMLYQLDKAKYSTTVSYKAEPGLGAVARINGIPLCLSFNEGEDKKMQELIYGGREIGGSHFVAITSGAFQNARETSESWEGPVIYTPIPRDESIEARIDNAHFGLLDLLVLRGYNVRDIDVQFRKIYSPDSSSHSLAREFSERYASPGQMLARSFGGAMHTAGRSGIGDVRKTKIETAPFGFTDVLFRDVFCLVHEEPGTCPRAYQQA